MEVAQPLQAGIQLSWRPGVGWEFPWLQDYILGWVGSQGEADVVQDRLVWGPQAMKG